MKSNVNPRPALPQSSLTMSQAGGNNIFSTSRLVQHLRVVPSSWCVHLWLLQLKHNAIVFQSLWLLSALCLCWSKNAMNVLQAVAVCYDYRKQKREKNVPWIRMCPHSEPLWLFPDDPPPRCPVYIPLDLVVYLWHFIFPWNEKRKSLKVWRGQTPLFSCSHTENPISKQPKLSCQGNTVE